MKIIQKEKFAAARERIFLVNGISGSKSNFGLRIPIQ